MRHSELIPQVPSQGLRHFSAIHAKSEGQSVLTTHSGRQLGGAPMAYRCWVTSSEWITSHFQCTTANWIMALFCGHSALTVHSGLQFGGEPIKESRHEHTAKPFDSRHLLLGPHGEGWQGLPGVGGGNFGCGRQLENGSPVYPSLHTQLGTWLTA
ncbi:hypothetical protein FF38_06818 [Lucilia cuprina]|uniref:Uncharacterized protein n=1 Tax=Lucilia cuprina TaxID=7375 RepID=A0A0L0C9D1_LUCCU|nr:hypothetical protein FF38_06818 [Lucilia cuprina]